MAIDFHRKGPHAARNKIVRDEIVSDVDERKTVILDEQLEDVEFDDKVWLYWTRNKTSIIATVVAAFAIIIGVQSYKLYRASAENALAAAYSAAATPDQLAAFAKDYAGTKLSGVALLQNADKLYADGKPADALKLYASAKGDLKATILYGRALIGEAVCVYSADKNKGADLLRGAYADKTIDPVFRAQAGYLLGLALKEQNKIEEAKTVLTSVSGDINGGYFAQLAQSALMSL